MLTLGKVNTYISCIPNEEGLEMLKSLEDKIKNKERISNEVFARKVVHELNIKFIDRLSKDFKVGFYFKVEECINYSEANLATVLHIMTKLLRYYQLDEHLILKHSYVNIFGSGIYNLKMKFIRKEK